MNQKKLRNRRLNALNRRNAASLNVVETLAMRLRGRFDAKRELPKLMDDGAWDSPRIRIERRKYFERTSKLWAGLSVEHQEPAAKLYKLMASADICGNDLESARMLWEDARKAAQAETPVRLKGEDKLTDSQLAARRSAETRKANAPLKEKLERLEGEYAAYIAEIARVRSEIVEDIRVTGMISGKIKEHSLARIAVYWDAALKKHASKGKLPVEPAVELFDMAGKDYANLRNGLLEEADRMTFDKEEVTHE